MVEFTVTFNVEKVRTTDWATYREFIESLRQQTQLIYRHSHGRPVLHPEIKPPTKDRWFDILLKTTTKTRGAIQVTLRIRLSNLYLDGYQMANSQWFEFGTDPKPAHLIPGSRCLGFDEGYDDLEGAAKERREKIKLGWKQLQEAVEVLAYSEDRQERAKALIVAVQMMSESIRFRSISKQLATKFQDDTAKDNKAEPPPIWMIEQESSGWKKISDELLHIDSDPTHRFVPPDPKTGITTVEQAVEAIGMLKYYKYPKIGGEVDDTVAAGEEEKGGEYPQPTVEGVLME